MIAALTIASTGLANADTSPHPAPDYAPSSEPIATDAPLAPLAEPAAPEATVQRTAAFVSRGRFSGGRLVVEILASATIGSLVGYGVYSAAGGGDSIGAVFAGLGAEIAVVPLVVYGAGRMMGGEGTLYHSYVCGLLAFSGPSATTQEATLSLAVGMALMPVMSAVGYELSSHLQSKKLEFIANGLLVAPTVGSSGVSGVRGGFSFEF